MMPSIWTGANPWLLNSIVLLTVAYEQANACWVGPFVLPDELLIPITIISAFTNGWVGVEVYLHGDRLVQEASPPHQQTVVKRRVRYWTTLMNQMGSLIGTYVCLALTVTDTFATPIPFPGSH